MTARTTATAAALTVLSCAVALRVAGDVPRTEMPGAAVATCVDAPSPLALGSAQWNGWGRDVENTRYQPEPALRATDVPKLGLKWTFGFDGSAVTGQPTVVDGRLFVANSAGRVYSLDASTGCTYWSFDAGAGTHSTISVGEFAPPRAAAAPRPVESRPRHKSSRKHGKAKTSHRLTLAHLDIVKAPSAAFFGDDAGAVYALDAQRGGLLWKTQVESHPSARIVGSPTVYLGRLYVAVSSDEQRAAAFPGYPCCTFRGSVAALDMTTGRILWKSYVIPEEAGPGTSAAGRPAPGAAGAAIEGAPTIDIKRNLVYVGTGGALTDVASPLTDAVVALDLNDGSVRWSRQFSRHDQPGAADFGSSPIVRTMEDGKQVILAAQKSGIVYALDPERGGEVLWQTKVARDSLPGGVEWGAAADHRRLYVALSGLIAEPDNTSGGLAALDMKTGVERWYTPVPQPACSWGAELCSHAESQAVTVIPGVAFSGSMDGHLRAYSTIDGKILWDYETAKEYATVNGVKASGGSLDQGGATIVNGVIYINSGYGARDGRPGNVLLAFSVDGK